MKVEHLFSKLKNSNSRHLDVRDNRQIRGLLDLLYREGIIRYYGKVTSSNHPLNKKSMPKSFLFLRVFLKSKFTQQVQLPTRIKRRPFVKSGKLVSNHIISTSSLGICTGREARRAHIGGTILGTL